MPEMHALFIGVGPDFQNTGGKNAPMNSLDLYNLMAYLMGIVPKSNNGTNNMINLVTK